MTTAVVDNPRIDQDLANRLAEIVGDRRVLFRPSELLTYTADGLPSYFKIPGLAVFPGKREEVIAVVRELARRRTGARLALA